MQVLSPSRSAAALEHLPTSLGARDLLQDRHERAGLAEPPGRKERVVEALAGAALVSATAATQARARPATRSGRVRAFTINPGQWMRWWTRQLQRVLEDRVSRCAHLSDADLVDLLAALAWTTWSAWWQVANGASVRAG